jgi:hypothetical protein
VSRDPEENHLGIPRKAVLHVTAFLNSAFERLRISDDGPFDIKVHVVAPDAAGQSRDASSWHATKW